MTTYWPSTYPIRTAPTGPSKGTELIETAAEEATIAVMSPSKVGSAAMIIVWIWISSRKPSGNSGRMGRSIIRMVRISLLVGRPSRLKNPPGNLPAA